MRYPISDSYDPAFNQAQEEYFLKQSPFPEDLMIFWITDKTCLVGKNQNTLAEINEEYVRQENIHVVRRLSGGGCIFMDRGNLLFTFITRNGSAKGPDFRRFTEPVAAALQRMGLAAEVSGRNDILLGGRKFSGNAQYVYRDRVLHHGSMLFSTDLEELVRALNVSTDKIASKGVASVRSRVTRIVDHLADKAMTIETFRDRLIGELQKEFVCGTFIPYRTTRNDIEAIEAIADQRFRSWEWTYGKSPRYSLTRKGRFPGGGVEFRLDVANGLIRDVQVFGDFFSQDDLGELESRMNGLRFDQAQLRHFFSGIELHRYFGAISADELASLFPSFDKP